MPELKHSDTVTPGVFQIAHSPHCLLHKWSKISEDEMDGDFLCPGLNGLQLCVERFLGSCIWDDHFFRIYHLWKRQYWGPWLKHCHWACWRASVSMIPTCCIATLSVLQTTALSGPVLPSSPTSVERCVRNIDACYNCCVGVSGLYRWFWFDCNLWHRSPTGSEQINTPLLLPGSHTVG